VDKKAAAANNSKIIHQIAATAPRPVTYSFIKELDLDSV
jgi:hypothetical protein